MRTYEGRIVPYTEADFLEEGYSAKEASKLAAASDPVRHRRRIYVHDGERRYELTAGLAPKDEVNWGYKGAGPARSIDLIVDDLAGFDRTDAIVEAVEKEIIGLDGDDDFALPETAFTSSA